MNPTFLENAFDYDTVLHMSQFTKPIYLPICIYCSNPDSQPLLQDGSFRQCLKCRKNFKPILKPVDPLNSPPLFQNTLLYRPNTNTNTNTNTNKK